MCLFSNIIQSGNKDLTSVTQSKKSNHQTFGGHRGEDRKKEIIIKVTEGEFCTSKRAENAYPSRQEELEEQTLTSAIYYNLLTQKK